MSTIYRPCRKPCFGRALTSWFLISKLVQCSSVEVAFQPITQICFPYSAVRYDIRSWGRALVLLKLFEASSTLQGRVFDIAGVHCDACVGSDLELPLGHGGPMASWCACMIASSYLRRNEGDSGCSSSCHRRTSPRARRSRRVPITCNPCRCMHFFMSFKLYSKMRVLQCLFELSTGPFLTGLQPLLALDVQLWDHETAWYGRDMNNAKGIVLSFTRFVLSLLCKRVHCHLQSCCVWG